MKYGGIPGAINNALYHFLCPVVLVVCYYEATTLYEHHGDIYEP